MGNDVETANLGSGCEASEERYGCMLGRSRAMRCLFRQLRLLEGSKVNVLVTGESGTGKELLSRAVHEHSVVRGGPLITVNCGALDRDFVRSELFGHERGAFTGAIQRRIGAFEAADGGTLFLDEIGELPLSVQPVLLRALETRCITPLGMQEERPVDVRLIAATHRDLQSLVQSGQFREDLFYRVQVVKIEMPPLRERPSDIPVLAHAMARRLGVTSLPSEFEEALVRHHWPGNVRELKNAVEAFVALGVMPGSPARRRDNALDSVFSELVDLTRSYADQKAELLDRFNRVYFQRVLDTTGGNQSKAARVSGLERSHLTKLVAKFGLRSSQ